MQYYIQALGKYAVFSGRATRREFWFFVLFYCIFSFCAYSVDFLFQAMAAATALPSLRIIGIIVSCAYELALFVPLLAITFRRLHDSGRSGWWYGGWWIATVMLFLGISLMDSASDALSAKTYSDYTASLFGSENVSLFDQGYFFITFWGLAWFVLSIFIFIFCLQESKASNKYRKNPFHEREPASGKSEDIVQE